jgi:hypothetical protein
VQAREEAALSRMTSGIAPPPRGVAEAQKEAAARLKLVKRPAVATKRGLMTEDERRREEGRAIGVAGARDRPANDIFVTYKLREKTVRAPVDAAARAGIDGAARTRLDASVADAAAGTIVSRKFKPKTVGL